MILYYSFDSGISTTVTGEVHGEDLLANSGGRLHAVGVQSYPKSYPEVLDSHHLVLS